MRHTKILVLFLAFVLVMGGLLLAQENKDKEIYEKARKSIYKKDWERAIEDFDRLIKEFEESKYMDQSFYYLAFSMDKLSQQMEELEEQIKYKKGLPTPCHEISSR